MNRVIERLITLKVGDVMTKSVVEISAHQTMTEAAALLVSHEVSGVPVTDETGRCVGILSAANFVLREHVGEEGVRSATACAEHLPVCNQREEPLQTAGASKDLVCAHMSSSVQSISEDQSLLAAARIMCSQHIHRLPVLDSGGHPVAMLSSTDIIAAVVNIVDEMEATTLPRKENR